MVVNSCKKYWSWVVVQMIEDWTWWGAPCTEISKNGIQNLSKMVSESSKTMEGKRYFESFWKGFCAISRRKATPSVRRNSDERCWQNGTREKEWNRCFGTDGTSEISEKSSYFWRKRQFNISWAAFFGDRCHTRPSKNGCLWVADAAQKMLNCRIYGRRTMTVKRKSLVFNGLEKMQKTGLFPPKVGVVGK